VVLEERQISGDQKERGFYAEEAVIVVQNEDSHKSTDPDNVQRAVNEKVT
jgi:hypothetical protein